MKKFLLILVTAMMGLSTLSLSAQSTLIVADGAASNSYVPVYGYYTDAFLRSQTIYPSSMLTQMSGMAINSLTFYLAEIPVSNWNCNFEVKLAEVSNSSFTTPSFIENSTVTVYTGPLNIIGDSMTVDLEIPFNYPGGNLLLEVSSVNTGSYSSCAYVGISSTGGSVCGYSYVDVSDVYPTYEDFIPKTKFIYGIPALCSKPYNLAITSLSSSTATVSWKGSAGSSSYAVQYMPVSMNNWNDDATEVIVYDTSITISNLTPSVSYKMRVMAACSDNTTTDWSAVFVFTTPNTPVNLPYIQNFETNSGNITDFTFHNNGVNGWFIGSATGAPSPGTSDSAVHSLYISDNDGVTNSYTVTEASYAYAVLDVAFGDDPVEWHLSFDYKLAGENSYDYFSVAMIDPSSDIPTSGDPNGTSLLYHIAFDTVWTSFDAILENVSGTSKRIVFYWKNDNSMGNQPPVAVDNIRIVSYTCPQPAQFAIMNIGDDNVTLDWDEMGNATSWNISYGPEGFTPGDTDGVTIVANTHPFYIGNLTSSTVYDFYVQSSCESNWAGPLTIIPGSYTFGLTGNDTLTTCNLLLYDNGGNDGHYLTNSDYYLVLYPSSPGEMMMVTGTLNTEANYDYLDIYDGDNTSSLIGKFTGLNQTVTAISTTGPLTLYFHSDYSIVNSGFQLLAECVHCFPPSDLTVSNEFLTGATVSWSGSADSYAIYLNGTSTGYYTTTDTFYNFTGLASSSSYSVQVRSFCGPDSSILSQAVNIFTACDAITITENSPWFENFDNYVGGGAETLICWETPISASFEGGTFPAVYCGHEPSCHSGANSVEFKASYDGVNMALLPEFTNNIHDLRLSFWATATSVDNGTMEVGVLTDPNDITTFELVDVCGTPGPRGSGSTSGNGNFMGPFNFSGVQAASGRIALRFTSNSYSLSWNLDDFTVELIPNCQSPVKTSLSADNIDGHSATISWVDYNPFHNSWTVFYKPSSDSTWMSATASTMSVVLTNLIPETSYDVYVITNCGTPVANPDATLTYHFTTDVSCVAPTDLTVSNIGTDHATISWTGNASSYNVEYGVAGFTPGTGTSSVLMTNSINLTNLTPNTNYTLMVTSDCGVYGFSTVSTIDFATSMIPVNLPYSTNFTDSTDAWALNNGSCNNFWMIGEYNNGGALFVTNDTVNPGYNVLNTSVVSAEKLFTVGTDNSFYIGFDVQVGGESTWDYLKVFFAPSESSYPASNTVPTFAEYSYSQNAISFENYLNLTSYTSNPYKFNLTGGNTVHVEVEVNNPNTDPTSTSTAKLVFVWKNDNNGGIQPGAIISNVSVTLNTCPIPSDLTVSSTSANTATINWSAGGEETNWELEYGAAGFTHGEGTIVPVSTLPEYTLTNLTIGEIYDVYVRAACDTNDKSPWFGPLNVIPGSYIMPVSGTYSITSCEMLIYDNGGPVNNYSNSCDAVLTIYPEDESNMVSIQGTLNTENCCDYLNIYNGADTSATLLGSFKGQNIIIPEIISTTGPLTIYFYSDYSLNYSGFELTVACVSNFCVPPTDLTVSNIGITTADVSWTAGGNENTWNVSYKEVSASTWDSLVVTGTPSCQLTNLTLNSNYIVRVQADCGSESHSLWVSTTFHTNCEAITTFPYYEDFEHNGDMPDCWNQEYVVGSTDWTAHSGNFTTGSTAHSGAYNAYFYFNNNTDPNTTKLISPIFDLTSMTTPALTYWYSQQNWGNDQDYLSVYYRTSTSSEWQLLVEYPAAVPNWTMDSILLPNPSATYQIAFEGLAAYGYGITLDDITIEDVYVPVLIDPTVTTIAATNVTETTATLNGTITNPDNVTISAKGFNWKLASATSYTTVNVTEDNLTYNLTGLTPNTEYTYMAFITFDSTTVFGEEMTFTTLEEVIEPCDVPTGLIVTSTTHESISISWNPNPNVSSWTIKYQPQGGSINTVTATTNNFTITGLEPQTSYYIQLQANCSSGQTSDWSITVTGTTDVGIDEHLLKHVSLYPNPANDVINVECTMNNVHIEALEVFDVYGKLINTVDVIDNPTRINVSGLANGMYFVRVTTGEGVVTKSFIKK